MVGIEDRQLSGGKVVRFEMLPGLTRLGEDSGWLKRIEELPGLKLTVLRKVSTRRSSNL
jgi:hypothetical protein